MACDSTSPCTIDCVVFKAISEALTSAEFLPHTPVLCVVI